MGIWVLASSLLSRQVSMAWAQVWRAWIFRALSLVALRVVLRAARLG
jgi:hypothetical protein